MKLRARLLASFAVVLAVSAGVALLVTPIPMRDRLLAFGIVIVVGLVVAFAVAETVARPLRDLSETAERVATGDLSARAHAHGLEVVDALAFAQAGEDPGDLVGAVFRDQDRNWAPHHLVRGVAVDAFRPGIPADDRAVECLADDRVVRRIDDRREVVSGPCR